MFALNRSHFSGWIIANQLGAIRQDKMSAMPDSQAPVEAEAGQSSRRDRKTDFFGLLQPCPLAVWAIFDLVRRQL